MKWKNKIKDENKFVNGIIEIDEIILQNTQLYDNGLFDEEELSLVLNNYMIEKFKQDKFDEEICNIIDEIIEDEDIYEEYKKELGII